MPWLVWLNGLSAGLQTKGSLVRFPARAHAWIEGQVPSRGRTRGNYTLMFLSSPSFPFSLKMNKIFKKKQKIRTKTLKSEARYDRFNKKVITHYGVIKSGATLKDMGQGLKSQAPPHSSHASGVTVGRFFSLLATNPSSEEMKTFIASQSKNKSR